MWEFLHICTRAYSLKGAVCFNAKHGNVLQEEGRNLMPLLVRFAHTNNVIEVCI